ncbi:hypothetical protein CBR_g22424 [Chara braunii]|uniref:Uncharacterized protein n=1 Tax=Chara braunii TaxID=69332 RepID=A0A388JUZ5_CHABU|nr:hypothetical protein CBR_g22424 [Chara braunii]|eukprot:GBG61626.1 hypothetical protein CBR_g22424 [Chara braunii]
MTQLLLPLQVWHWVSTELAVDLVAVSRCRIVPVPGAVVVASRAEFDVFLPGVVFASASSVAVPLGLAALAVGVATAAAVALALVGHTSVVVAFVTAVPEPSATASAVGTGFPPELAVDLDGAVIVPSATAFGFVLAPFEYVAVPDVVFANATGVAVPLGLAALVVGVAATASVAVAFVGHTAVAVAFVTAAPGEWTVAGVVGSGSNRGSVPAPVSVPDVEAPRSAGQVGVPGGGHPKWARDEILSVRSHAGHLSVPDVEASRSAGQMGVPGGGYPKGARDEVVSVRSRAGHLSGAPTESLVPHRGCPRGGYGEDGGGIQSCPVGIVLVLVV